MSKKPIVYNLPNGWIETLLGEIITLEYGKGLTGLERERGMYKVWGSNGVVGTHNDFLIDGPVIIVGRKGSVGVIHYSPDKCWPIDTTYYINSIKSLSTLFIYYLLKHLNLSSLDKSTTIPGLNREIAYSQRILLPPLEEQCRIVEKIEELFSEIENVEQNLLDINKRLNVYWQAILDNAFERVTNRKLSFFTTFIGAGSTPKGGRSIYVRNGIPFIRSQNVLHYSLNLDDVVYITDEINKKMSRTKVHPNDVLLNITGASIGRCTYVPDYLNQGNVNQHVCIIRTTPDLSYKYLALYLNSPKIQRLIQKWSSGATREALTLFQINDIPIPICPLAEQELIVAELESQYTILENVKETIIKKLSQIEVLKQSILSKAFTGNLVPQNSNDKPASALLKKIKEEQLGFLPKVKKVKNKMIEMERTKSVLDLLKEAKESIPAKDVWQQSKHWESIDDFYAELRSISDMIEQTKLKTEVLLSLKK